MDNITRKTEEDFKEAIEQHEGTRSRCLNDSNGEEQDGGGNAVDC
jgi:hypothetical protein